MIIMLILIYANTELNMEYSDDLSTHYAPLLDGKYDCIDRIVLNAFYPMLLQPGGVRNWYRLLKGEDASLKTEGLMRFAGRISRRVEAYCKSKGIPFLRYNTGERKHEDAQKLIPQDKNFTGIFAVFCARAPSLLWEVKTFASGNIDIRRKEKASLVSHYYFHIMDREWGHIMIRMCAHPPFGCNIILNGHEWVERNPAIKNLEVKKEDNCFTRYNNGEKLSGIADTLKDKGQLDKVCQRWVYCCLWFALDHDEQTRTNFRYQFSVYQVEYSRNLLFKLGRQLDDVYQNIINLTRSRLDIDRLKTIFGKKHRPRQKTRASAPEVRIETPDYNLTIFKIHFGKLTVKLYDKGERTLRAEVVVHNSKALGCKRSLEFFGGIVDKLHFIMRSFLDNLEYLHLSHINDGSLEVLAAPSQKGKNRLAGINLNNKRNTQVMQVVQALSIKPGGFTVKDIAEKMSSFTQMPYSISRGRYDIRKLKAKNLLVRIKGKKNYSLTKEGIQIITAVLSYWNHQIPALLAAVNHQEVFLTSKELSQMEKHLNRVKEEIAQYSNLYGIQHVA
jgi:DNA-binding MarR family transcriptional regulator